MKNLIIVVAVLVLIGYAVSQWVNNFKAKSDLAARVTEQLNFVDENSQPAVKQKLVDEAHKVGIDLVPDNIQISYEDTDQQTMAEHFTAKVATFVNKRVTIRLSYTARLAGIPLHQEIMDSHIRQIQVRERERPELQQLLEAAPQ
ncbi:MAG: hypothetical protein ABSH21_08580 [Verrucomicrobiia bacterium]|jgi:hypothetical protein